MFNFAAQSTFNKKNRQICVGIENRSQLFSAWWYDNGKTATISQVDWRLRMLAGDAAFFLVNVTADSEHTLIEQLRRIFEAQTLNIDGK